MYSIAIKLINIPRITLKTYEALTTTPTSDDTRTDTHKVSQIQSHKSITCVYTIYNNNYIVIYYHRAWIVLIDLLIFRRSLITSSFFIPIRLFFYTFLLAFDRSFLFVLIPTFTFRKCVYERKGNTLRERECEYLVFRLRYARIRVFHFRHSHFVIVIFILVYIFQS